MRRQKAFRIASGIALVAWVATALSAAIVAGFGVVGLTGWGEYRYHLDVPVPLLSLELSYQPSWEVLGGGEVCERVDMAAPSPDCHNVVLRHGEPVMDGRSMLQSDVRPVAANLSGPLLLDAEPGWNPLMASLYFMQVLTLGVLAFVLAQLWLLLRAASRGMSFTDTMVRRLRVMGGTLVGWEVVEPFLWLFFSPKANDYVMVTIGPAPQGLHLGSMEPGGPSLVVVAFGLLLLLLAELFRHGADLADEQRLTV